MKRMLILCITLYVATANATVITEYFDYGDRDISDPSGLSGGSGWSGNWENDTTGAKLMYKPTYSLMRVIPEYRLNGQGGRFYSNGLNQETGYGNTGDCKAKRSVGSLSGTIWLSTMMNTFTNAGANGSHYSYIYFNGDAANYFGLNGYTDKIVVWDGSEEQIADYEEGNTTFVVAKLEINYSGTSDRLTIWINPDPSARTVAGLGSYTGISDSTDLCGDALTSICTYLLCRAGGGEIDAIRASYGETDDDAVYEVLTGLDAGSAYPTTPNIVLTSPTSSDEYSVALGQKQNIDISADIDSANAISSVDFYVDGELIGSDSSTPFSTVWKMYGFIGSKDLTAVATDTLSNVGTSNVVKVYCTIPGLLAYDDLSVTNQPLHDVDSGKGWLGSWAVQHGDINYKVESASPMSYGDMYVSGGGYTVGGGSWVSSGRKLDCRDSGTFADVNAYIDNQWRIAPTNSSIWFSCLCRPTANTQQHIALNDYVGVTYIKDSVVSIINNGGYWGINFRGGSYSNTTHAVTIDETYLLVVNMRFGEFGVVDHYIDFYVNPETVGGDAPATPDATIQVTTDDFYFAGIYWYPDSGSDKGNLDDLRFGTTYAAVTPVEPPSESIGTLLIIQ